MCAPCRGGRRRVDGHFSFWAAVFLRWAAAQHQRPRQSFFPLSAWRGVAWSRREPVILVGVGGAQGTRCVRACCACVCVAVRRRARRAAARPLCSKRSGRCAPHRVVVVVSCHVVSCVPQRHSLAAQADLFSHSRMPNQDPWRREGWISLLGRAGPPTPAQRRRGDGRGAALAHSSSTGFLLDSHTNAARWGGRLARVRAGAASAAARLGVGARGRCSRRGGACAFGERKSTTKTGSPPSSRLLRRGTRCFVKASRRRGPPRAWACGPAPLAARGPGAGGTLFWRPQRRRMPGA